MLNSGAGDAIDVRGVGDFDGGGDFSCFILLTPKLYNTVLAKVL